MKRLLFLASLLSGILFSQFIQAAPVCPNDTGTECIFYVSPSGGGDCSSDSSPCPLQNALNDAEISSKDNTIHLAAGTYTGNFSYTPIGTGFLHLLGHAKEDTFVTSGDLSTDALQLVSLASITVSQITFEASQRGLFVADGLGMGTMDLSIHDCIFSGNQQGTYIDIEHMSGSINLTNNNFENNTDEISMDNGGAGVAIYLLASSVPITLSGNNFTGNTLKSTGDDEGGGALYINDQGSNSPVLLTGGTFSDNHYIQSSRGGGGAFIATNAENSPVTVKGVTFDGNTTSGEGGGLDVYVGGPSSPVVVGGSAEGEANTFTNNSSNNNAGGGGFVAVSDVGATNSTLSIVNNTISGNTSYWGGGFQIDTNTSGGAITVTGNTITGNHSLNYEGGGAHIWAAYGLTFTGNTIEGNDATYIGGGGIAIDFDGGNDNTFSNLIENNTFSNNGSTGGWGGGLIVNPESAACNCSIVLNANLFEGNTSGVNGGGLALSINDNNTPLTLTNNFIVNGNTAVDKGGGLYVSFGHSNTGGMNFINNTISGNTVQGQGGGVYWDMGGSGGVMNAYNNIFWSNTSSGGDQNGSDAYAYFSGANTLVFNNNDREQFCQDFGSGPACDSSNSSNTLGSNNINQDPLFLGAGSGINPYRLKANSPVIQAGNASAPGLPAHDYTGTVAMDTPNPDLGALQYTLTQFSITVTPDASTAEVGSNFSWTVTVTNTGDAESFDDVLADITAENQNIVSGVSASLTALRRSASSFSCSGTNPLACNLGIIEAGTSVSFKVNTQVTAEGTLTLTVNVSSNAGTVMAMAVGTAQAGGSGNLSGTGCGLNPVAGFNLSTLWVYALILLFPVIRSLKKCFGLRGVNPYN